MLRLNDLWDKEILNHAYNCESKRLDKFDLLEISEETYSRWLYKNIIFDKLSPNIIKALINEYSNNYLNYVNDLDITLFLEKLINYVIDKYPKLINLDFSFWHYIVNSIIFIDIPVKNKIHFITKLYWKDFPSEFIKYLVKNVENFNDLLDDLREINESYIISLFDNYTFSLPDDKIDSLKDEYLFLYSIIRKEKLFPIHKNKDFLEFVLNKINILNSNVSLDLIFRWWIEIDDETIIPILKIFFDWKSFYDEKNILNSVKAYILTNNIVKIANLIIEYLLKPESVTLDKEKIKRFFSSLIKLLLQNKNYKALIKLIVKIYDSDVNFDKRDLIILDDKLILNFLSSSEISQISVYKFEKIIYFWLYFENIRCSTLSNVKFKLLYNRFAVYRTLKIIYKKKIICHFWYDFLSSLRKNYRPFSTSYLFYFLYWVYLKTVWKN